MDNLTGRVALVTGAGPQMGGTIAQTLAARGAAVVCNDLRETRADDVAQAIIGAGGRAVAVPGDASDPAVVRRFIEAGEANFGTIDILVHHAAGGPEAHLGLLDATVSDFEAMLHIVLTASFLNAKAVAERLIEQKKPGAFVFTGSTSGHRGRAGALAYSAAKGGLLNMVRAMACDLAPYKIRVNSASPTRTGAHHPPPNEIPLGRLGEAQDLANAVAFLVSDDAGFITGEDLRVDGGALATWGIGDVARR